MTAQPIPLASAHDDGDTFARLARKVELNMPLTPAEAAEFTGYPWDTLRKMVAEGRIKRAVLSRGTGKQRRHYMLLPKELLEELRESQRRN